MVTSLYVKLINEDGDFNAMTIPKGWYDASTDETLPEEVGTAYYPPKGLNVKALFEIGSVPSRTRPTSRDRSSLPTTSAIKQANITSAWYQKAYRNAKLVSSILSGNLQQIFLFSLQ